MRVEIKFYNQARVLLQTVVWMVVPSVNDYVMINGIRYLVLKRTWGIKPSNPNVEQGVNIDAASV